MTGRGLRERQTRLQFVVNGSRDGRGYPACHGGHEREAGKRRLFFHLRLFNRGPGSRLAACVRGLWAALPFSATVMRFLAGDEKAYAISALEEENGGRENQRKKSLAAHALKVQR